jgi:tetratricopeptide (TPR) repeat protein
MGTLAHGTVYITLRDSPDGMHATTILLDVNGEIIDVIMENTASATIMADEQRGTLVAEARRLLGLNRPGQALPFADDAVALDASDPDARAVRADIRRQLNDLSGAEADATEALKLDPFHPEGLRAMAHVHRALERWDECIHTATTRIRDAPRDGPAWTVRAMCYQGAGAPRKAITGAREACSQGDPEGCALARSLEE